MLTVDDIQNAINNGEIEMWEVEKLVRGVRAQGKLDGERAPATALHPFIDHNPRIRKTAPTKDGCTFKATCSCGYEGRFWIPEQARAQFDRHQQLSGWRR